MVYMTMHRHRQMAATAMVAVIVVTYAPATALKPLVLPPTKATSAFSFSPALTACEHAQQASETCI
jgi:hypothetical protein